MYVVANISSNAVEGTQSENPIGSFFGANGKFFLPTPPGVPIDINALSTLTPQTSGSLPYRIAHGFLERNPNYDNVLWNFFLEVSDLALLDQSAGAPTPTGANVSSGYAPLMVGSALGPRCQIGRSVGPAPIGVAPNSIAIFPANTKTTGTPVYGSLVYDLIDLTPFNPATPGTDEVLVWWKIAKATTSEDISHGYASTAGINQPSLRSLEEISQAPSGFHVYVSVDDGVSWYECKYMRPKDLAVAGKDFRIAFINEGSEKIFLLAFAVLFPNL